MCLAVPAKVKDIGQEMATCAVDGGQVRIQASLVLLDEEVVVGDYVLIHAGFALRRLDRQEALETLDLLREMAQQDDNPVSW
ncbi:MAG: HypC/HybG/HupF family hydrogenase formation chaperone [Desulfohalobiaceae bacterium]|nr:HypC/HybG/HupF family hydrogenase formation chaperone [Desulfohalobiaceae bacterium]